MFALKKHNILLICLQTVRVFICFLLVEFYKFLRFLLQLTDCLKETIVGQANLVDFAELGRIYISHPTLMLVTAKIQIALPVQISICG